jgi:hypothetical protein
MSPVPGIPMVSVVIVDLVDAILWWIGLTSLGAIAFVAVAAILKSPDRR